MYKGPSFLETITEALIKAATGMQIFRRYSNIQIATQQCGEQQTLHGIQEEWTTICTCSGQNPWLYVHVGCWFVLEPQRH